MNLNIVALPAVIVGLVQVIKRTNVVPDSFLPLLDVVLGVIGGLLIVSPDVNGAIQGLLAGLSAAGLYDVAKEPVQKALNAIK